MNDHANDHVNETVAHELLAKLLGALVGEQLLEAVDEGDGVRRLTLEHVTYTFRATTGAFGSLRVDPASTSRSSRGVLGDDEIESATDPVQLLTDAASTLGLDPTTLANYVAELAATLAADAEIARTAVPAADVVAAPHAEMDGYLTGHPLLVANKGRLGFSASDRARYAPEARRPLRPVWLAVSRRLAEFRAVPSLSEDALVAGELDAATLERFQDRLQQAGLEPTAFVLLPAHPWQVDHVVHQLWAPSVLGREVLVLDEADDDYLPTQSIRTLVNVSTPWRHQVKLPLKILNTSVYRGVPRHCSLYAPVTTHWLRGIWRRDPALRDGAHLLGEVASVTVRHPQLSDAPVPYQWDETLGCIWREPVETILRDGETAWPLALVLHRDPAGGTAVGELVRRSGLPVDEWLAHLVAVVVRPLLRLLHTYGISVNPHGENLAVVCDADGVPVRLVIKDLVDDVCVSTEPVPERGWEPDGEHRALPRKPWHVLRQYLVDALLLGVWEPLATVVDTLDPRISGDVIWESTRREVLRYAEAHTDQADRLAATGLLEPEVARYPLNGYRLRLGYVDLVDRPPVPRAGTMPNPLTAPGSHLRGQERRAG